MPRSRFLYDEYACTRVMKQLAVDDFVRGVDTARLPVIDAPCAIVGDSLPHLIHRLEAQYGLTLPSEELFIRRFNTRAQVYLNFAQLEDTDGDRIEFADELDAWKRGELHAWRAYYSFTIEWRLLARIPVKIFKESNIVIG